MARNSKRKNVPPASSNSSKSSKRQRKAPQVFEQGVNPPAPLTPPSTVRRPQRSQNRTPQPDTHNRGRGAAEASPSPLFEPEPSQLATDAHAADILGEDEDEEEPVNATADEEEAVVDEGVSA